MVTPMVRPTTITNDTTIKETRAPCMTRLNTSRPRWSVPRRYLVLPPTLVTTSISSPILTPGLSNEAFCRVIWNLISLIDNRWTTVLSDVSELAHTGGVFLSLRSLFKGSWGDIQGAVIPTKIKAPSIIAGIMGILRNRLSQRTAFTRGASGAKTTLPAVCSAISASSFTDY